MRNISLMSAIVLVVMTLPALGQDVAPSGSGFGGATTQPAGPANVPPAVIEEIRQQFQPPREKLGQAAAIELRGERMSTVLALGAQAEADYPHAENLYLVQKSMLEAAMQLSAQKRDQGSLLKSRDIAARLASSNAPPDHRLPADYLLLSTAARLPAQAGAPPTAKDLRDFVQKYEQTDVSQIAMAYGAFLAMRMNNPRLHDELVKKLEAGYRDDPTIRRFLRRMGRSPDKGRPFQAELTRLDGSRLTLPDDLLGQVYVVDFWATWCQPCVASLPEMKALYAKYKPLNVEIVSVSLDRPEDRQKLVEFVRDEQLGWIHAYSGMGWADPTAQRYGVEAIPSVWVVGKDGLVVSDNARGNLEAVIQQALNAPTSQPVGVGTGPVNRVFVVARHHGRSLHRICLLW